MRNYPKLLKQKAAYSILGYEEGNPKREQKTLDECLHAFFRTFIRDNKFTGCINEPAAEVCADRFLNEDGQGEIFWPPTTDQVPIWSQHQDTIIDAVRQIFIRKARSEGVRKCRFGDIRKPSESVSVKRKTESESELSERPVKKHLAEPKPWQEPPHEPDPKTCILYIRSLSPKNDSISLTKEWLQERKALWPESADLRLQVYMHNANFYMTFDHGDEIPLELSHLLRKGTSIEELEAQQIPGFYKRISERVKYLTLQLVKEPLYVLEFRRDGTTQQTSRFARMWQKKEEYWQAHESELGGFNTGASMAKKRRKPKKQKEPISFPNILAHVAESDTRARHEIASIAGSALRLDSSLGVGERMFVNNPQNGKVVEDNRDVGTTTPEFDMAELTSTPGESIVVDIPDEVLFDATTRSSRSPSRKSKSKTSAKKPPAAVSSSNKPSSFERTNTEQNLSPIENMTPTSDGLLSDAGTNPGSISAHQDAKPYFDVHCDSPFLPSSFERPGSSARCPMEIIDDTLPRSSTRYDHKLPTQAPTGVAGSGSNAPAVDEKLAQSILESWHFVEGLQNSDAEPSLETQLRNTLNQSGSPNVAVHSSEDRSCIGLSTSSDRITPPIPAPMQTPDRKEVRQNGLGEGVKPTLTSASGLASPVTPLTATERTGILDWTKYLDSRKDTRRESQISGFILDSSAPEMTSVPNVNTAQLDDDLVSAAPELAESLDHQTSLERLNPGSAASSIAEISAGNATSFTVDTISSAQALSVSILPIQPLRTRSNSQSSIQASDKKEAIIETREVAGSISSKVSQSEQLPSSSGTINVSTTIAILTTSIGGRTPTDSVLVAPATSRESLNGPGDLSQKTQPEDCVQGIEPRRNGIYAFVPDPIPFSTFPPTEDKLPPQPPTTMIPRAEKSSLSSDRRIAKYVRDPNIKTLELLIEDAFGNINIEDVYLFDTYVKHYSVTEFFEFYSQASGVALRDLTSLVFVTTFGKSRSFRVTKSGYDIWRRLKTVMPTLFLQAQREDPKQMQFEVMVQVG